MHDGGDRPDPLGQQATRRRIAPAYLALSPGPRPHRPRQAPRRDRVACAAAGALVAVAVIVTAASTTPTRVEIAAPGAAMPFAPAQAPIGGAVEPVVAPRPVGPAELARLPTATTFATVPAAPLDPAPTQVPSGQVVHPTVPVAVYARPGGEAIAVLPPQQLGSDTWVPVLAEQPGWDLVALPARPNGATGWLYRDKTTLTVARTPYRITVDRATFTLTLSNEDSEVGRWTVGVGKPQAVTPAGRTFLLASIRDTHATFSPIVLPLGAHSDTYTNYGGGPGTVALHTWPTRDVYGRPSSDGCIRVPPEALAVLSTDVPLGTAVLIT